MRGLEKVRSEFSLTALVYNLRRALNILGMEKLMASWRRENALMGAGSGGKGCFRAFPEAQAKSGADFGGKWRRQLKSPAAPPVIFNVAAVSTRSA